MSSSSSSKSNEWSELSPARGAKPGALPAVAAAWLKLPLPTIYNLRSTFCYPVAVNRRDFLTSATATTLLAPQRVLGANDRIRIGLIGAGGRCMYLAGLLKNLPGAEIVAACDRSEERRVGKECRL